MTKANHHPPISTHLHTDRAPCVLPATPLPRGTLWLRRSGPGRLYGGVTGVQRLAPMTDGCSNASKDSTTNNLRRTPSTRAFYVCNSNIFKSTWNLGKQQKHTETTKCSGIGLQWPIILSFRFCSNCIYRTTPPTLMYPIPPLCVLYALIAHYPIPRISPIQSLPLMETLCNCWGGGDVSCLEYLR